MKRLLLALGWITLLALVGCASPRQFVAMPQQSEEIPPDKARIYVFRRSLSGYFELSSVYDDKKGIGTTAGRSYLCWEREPGETTIYSLTPQFTGLMAKPGIPQFSGVHLAVEPGKAYYILQFVCMDPRHTAGPGPIALVAIFEILNEGPGLAYLTNSTLPELNR